MLRLIGVELFKLKKRWLVYALLVPLLVFSIVPIISNYSSYRHMLEEYPGIADIDVEITGDSDGYINITYINPQYLDERQLQMMATQAAYSKQGFTLPGALENTFSSIAGLGALLIVILTASAIGSEYRWGTLRHMLIKGTGRDGYLTSKLLGIGIVAVIGILIALLASFITSLITTAMAGGGINFDFLTLDFIGFMFSAFGGLLLTLAVYFCLTALFSVLLRSVTSGMVIGIVFIYADLIIVSLLTYANNWLQNLAPYTIGHNVSEISSLFTMNGDAESSILKATAILLGYCIVFLGISFYSFRRQDITTG
jgi:ABC-type transport system involved in multi-copper enzyme maturation permease subunit